MTPTGRTFLFVEQEEPPGDSAPSLYERASAAVARWTPSFMSLYHIMFWCCSLLGLVLYGYFFCFHLFHFALNNDVLSRVFKVWWTNSVYIFVCCMNVFERKKIRYVFQFMSVWICVPVSICLYAWQTSILPCSGMCIILYMCETTCMSGCNCAGLRASVHACLQDLNITAHLMSVLTATVPAVTF